MLFDGEGSIFLTTRAGTPNASALSGMSCVTTAPAPMTTLLPMVTPGHKVGWWNVVELVAEVFRHHALFGKAGIVVGIVDHACEHLLLFCHIDVFVCRHFAASFNPTIPATMSAAEAMRKTEADSPNAIMPTTTPPIAPIPVQTA